MDEESVKRLTRMTLTSDVITHCRLKYFASAASTSEDHISRLAIGLSVRKGEVESGWTPTKCIHEVPMLVFSPKTIKGSTILKEDIFIFAALIQQHQQPIGYESWRGILQAHWERGVQILTELAEGQTDWVRILGKIANDIS